MPLLLFVSLQVMGQSPILPPPQEIKDLSGSFPISQPLRITHPPNGDLEPLLIAHLLEEFTSDDEAAASLSLELASSDQFQNTEAYLLEILPSEINISASHPAGLFYGLQSLIQLKKHHGSAGVPCQRITDWPDLAHRVLMDDISRGPIPNTSFLKSQIRKLAQLKINGLTFYIEDVVKTKAHGSFAPHHGIDLAEFKILSEYAAGYNIELIGSFQSLGHFEKILRHPQYHHLGLTDRMLDPRKKEAQDFLIEVHNDMLPHFSSKFFNVNGDEAWDLARGDLEPLADSIGAGAIYGKHMAPVLENLLLKNKMPLLWADMVLEHPRAFELIPDETTLLTWDYSDRPDFNAWIDPIEERGFDFWICPGVLNSNRFMPDLIEARNNIDGFVKEGFAKGAKGMMLTVWDDGGRHFFGRDWYGVAAGAARSWQVNHDLSHSDYDELWSMNETGDPKHHLWRGINLLGKLKKYAATQNMSSTFVTQALVPEKGSQQTFNLSDHEAIENICDSALIFFEKAPDHPDLATWKFTAQQLKLIVQSKRELVALADLYRNLSTTQLTDSVKAMEGLIDLAARAEKLAAAWSDLQESFLARWSYENRDHWTEEALELYRDRTAGFSSLVSRLKQTKKDFSPHNGRYLPAPEQVQLGISLTSDAYFTFWLLNGPHRFNTFEPPFEDFLEPSGGEASAQPIPGDWHPGPDGEPIMWIKYQSPLHNQLDLKEFYGEMKGAIAYAYAQIESPVAQQVSATLGSNDGISVFLNGQSIYAHQEKRSLIVDEDEIKLDLKEGTNHLLLKLSQWKAAWGFSFRLPEVEVRNRKHKYVIKQ